jgi:hypothetical protein
MNNQLFLRSFHGAVDMHQMIIDLFFLYAQFLGKLSGIHLAPAYKVNYILADGLHKMIFDVRG